MCIQHLNVALYFALFKKNKDKVDVRYGHNQYQHLLFYLPFSLLFSSLLSFPTLLGSVSALNKTVSLFSADGKPSTNQLK